MSDELRDEQLSRLYREADGAGPPAALDAAILAAARAAVAAAPPRRRAWWQSWTLPMSIAASVVVTVTLTLMVQQEQERPAPEAPPAQVLRAPAAAPQEKSAAADLAVKPALPRAKQEAARREAERPSVAVPAPAPEAVAPAQQPFAAEPKTLPSPPAAMRPAQAPPAADAMEMRARSAPLRKEAVGAASARAPEPWLEDIRRLKREGKEREAAESLVEFRKAYPDYRLPEDLR